MHCLSVILLGSALAVAPLWAQPALLSGPVEGFTFDAPTQSFRAVIGLPGSASFGPALATGFDTGSVAPHKNYAIGFQQGNCFLLAGLDSDHISATPVAGGSGQPDAIAWSGDGSVAILYSRSGSWLQTLRGLPDAPQLGVSVDLSPLGGSLSAVASDPQGRSIALAVQGDNGGAFLLTDAQTFAPVLGMAHASALAFSGDGASLYVLDRAARQLVVLSLSDSSSRTMSLSGLQDPFAIGSGRDAQGNPVVYVASASDQMFRAYDPATEQVLVDLPLDFQPTGIALLGSNSFVIASRSQPTDSLWLFASLPQPAVYFVPAAHSSAGGFE